MKLKIIFTTLLTLALSANVTFGSDSAGPSMSPEIMKAMELMAPNEKHVVLEQFVGDWTYNGMFKMFKDAPAQELTGMMKSILVYEGRFLKQEVEGPWMGSKFEGLGFTGYDNVKEEYVTTWLDNTATGIMASSGDYDASTKTLNLKGKHSCAMSGEKERYYRSEWTLLSDNESVYKSYTLDPNGEEYMSMEIRYTRK